ncbi:molybdenum cofactor biosynthesis protein MoaE [Pseudofrankia sp. BMG5.36]|uniref:molybdenum cofactor biosynthesis protein MoaE n=1 Tax=Pseudofrankia sp. BMG5.36 TaxID=1834512 RepID=UPI0008DA1914|nr:molybdenum cofactor biosynthesis protein MoaE [Pseudofrankia sp. BMG5.36]OHV43819.1 hypothetical protein BCD48_26755 [Pseudofrankia sp. BMG5.36]
MSGQPSSPTYLVDDNLVGLTRDRIPISEMIEWAVTPACGAVVTFTGTVRDHSNDRVGVVEIDYEAFDRHVEARLSQIAAGARDRWPSLGRVALLHRIGRVPLGEASVLVVVSAPHREEAFTAGRFCIDLVKECVPVWKRESGTDGTSGWVSDGNPIEDVATAARRWHPVGEPERSVR